MPKERKPTFHPEYIRNLSEKAYRIRLEQDCPGNVARMIAKDKDEGQMLRNRAGAYDAITCVYLSVLGFEPSDEASAVFDDHSPVKASEVVR